MNSFELKQVKRQLEGEEGNILFSKGTEYIVSNDDRLNFFYEYANKLGADPKMVCAIFLMKHINSILNYVKTGKDSIEGIKGRIMDARNYLLFMEALIEENKDMEKIGGTTDEDVPSEEEISKKYPVTAKFMGIVNRESVVDGGTTKLTSTTEDEVRSEIIEENGYDLLGEHETELVDGDD